MLTRGSFVGRASIVLALAGASALIASPAIAAPGDVLPEGQHITGTVYAATDSDFGIQPVSVDSVTGTSTALGVFELGLASEVYASLDVDASGLGYMLTDFSFDTGWSYALVAIDANTGEFGEPFALSTADGSAIDYCEGLDYSAGVVRTICGFGYEDDTYSRAVSTIDASGVVTSEVMINPDLDGSLTELAMGPDGVLYVFGGDGTGMQIYAVAPGETTLDGTVHATIEEYRISGADFDRDGQLWASGGSDGTIELFTVDAASGAAVSVAPTTLDGEVVNFEGLTVWGSVPTPDPAPVAPIAPAADGPKNELAESGVDAASIGLLSGAVLLAGGVLFLLRRRSSESVN